MNQHKLLVSMLLLTLCLAALSPLAHAQFRGSLRGTVTDPQGAVIPNATVTLVNKSTNEALSAKSDKDGIYNFNALPPAPYGLSVAREGLQQPRGNFVPSRALADCGSNDGK